MTDRRARRLTEDMTMLEKVCNMLGEQLGIPAESIRPEQEVVKDLGADSLDVVELMMALKTSTASPFPRPMSKTSRRCRISSI